MCHVSYGVGLSYIVLTNNYNYDDCFSTYGYKFIIFIVLIKFNIYRMCFYEYLSFSGMMLVL